MTFKNRKKTLVMLGQLNLQTFSKQMLIRKYHKMMDYKKLKSVEIKIDQPTRLDRLSVKQKKKYLPQHHSRNRLMSRFNSQKNKKIAIDRHNKYQIFKITWWIQ